MALISTFFKTKAGFFTNLSESLFGKKEEIFEISGPTNFKQLSHVGWNAEKGEFEGLPPEFRKQLEISGISKDDQKANPDQVLKVLKFQNALAEGLPPRKMTTKLPPVPPIPNAKSNLPPAPIIPVNGTANLKKSNSQLFSPSNPSNLPPAPNPRIDENNLFSKPSSTVSPKAATLKAKKQQPSVVDLKRLSAKPVPKKQVSSLALKQKTTGKPLLKNPSGKPIFKTKPTGKPVAKPIKPAFKPKPTKPSTTLLQKPSETNSRPMPNISDLKASPAPEPRPMPTISDLKPPPAPEPRPMPTIPESKASPSTAPMKPPPVTFQDRILLHTFFFFSTSRSP